MSEIAERIAARIEALGGPGLVACAVPIGAGGALAPEEERAMARAVPGRRAEFAAGRDAARRAMRRLGWEPQAVPMRPDRSPHWPEGLCGSLSHDAGIAVAALRRGGACFGIDIAPAAPLESDLHDEIATAHELDQRAAGLTPGEIARLIFSAKEAAYKAQFPATGMVLGFDAMQVWIGAGHAAGGGLVARLARDAGVHEAGTAFYGGWARVAGRFVVVMHAPEASFAAAPGFTPRNTALHDAGRMVSRAGLS